MEITTNTQYPQPRPTEDTDVIMDTSEVESVETTKRGIGTSRTLTPVKPRSKIQKMDMLAGTQRRMNLHGGLQSTLRTVRFGLKLTVKSSDSAATTLLEVLSTFLEKIFEVEKGAEILGWAAMDGCKPFSCLEGLPTRMATLKKYFKNLSPRPRGGFLFSQVHIGINSTTKDFLEEMGWWLEEHLAGMWERVIQTENVVSVG